MSEKLQQPVSLLQQQHNLVFRQRQLTSTPLTISEKRFKGETGRSARLANYATSPINQSKPNNQFTIRTFLL